MSLTANADIFGPGDAALALARAAFGGRGFFTPVRRRRPDGSWLGAENAIDLAARDLVFIPYAYGEPEDDRRQRLLELGAAENAEGEESAEMISVPSSPSVPSIVPTPLGEPQGLDTVSFFTACRLALPRAHIVVDLELLGLKLGQLCLSFGADEIMGSILERRELRLGARAGSCELDRGEAAQLLRASGFVPYERLPDGKVRAS